MSKRQKVTTKQLEKSIVAGLDLLDSETADAIIGAQPDDHKVLLTAAQAVVGLLWSTVRHYGTMHNRTIDLVAKAQIVILTLIHYAYALGMKRGKQQMQ